MTAEWLSSLFGESEGKQGAAFSGQLLYSTDLHSLGQFVQDGVRCCRNNAVRAQEERHASIDRSGRATA
jgi:glucose-6-phosphate isomerase